MFNPTDILISNFVAELQKSYHRTYGNLHQEYSEIIAWAGSMALEIISGSDALYHNVEHTILVTLVGQEILRGKHIREGKVTPLEWLHFTIALLCHDIGYVKGVCRKDRVEHNLYDDGLGSFIKLKEGQSDAALTPFHVDRGKQFVEERFGGHAIINAHKIKSYIELTRFPVPSDKDHADTTDYPGLVRAADLLGQLSDSRYLQKIGALFYEFKETGTSDNLGYKNPGDLRKNYPGFYWGVVYKYVKPAINYLSVTQQGKMYAASLFANVFSVEHESKMAQLSDNSPKEPPTIDNSEKNTSASSTPSSIKK